MAEPLREPAPIHYERIYRFAESKVRRELRQAYAEDTGLGLKNLHYHTPGHTFDVVKTADRLAYAAFQKRNLTQRQMWLLKLAALYHDYGFTHQIKQNEPFGAQKAVEELGRLGLSGEDLDEIHAAILDTALVKHPDASLDTFHQAPKTLIGRYLCDSDLANLGRKDHLVMNERYRLEQNVSRPSDEQLSDNENLRRFQAFLQGHQWHTPEARELFGEQKRKNEEEVKRLIGFPQKPGNV